MTAELDDDPKCPHCGSTEPCEHVLLIVDLTFRESVGGALYRSFNDRWSSIFERNAYDDDFDEKSSFEELIDEVDGIADFTEVYDFEGGPGCSASYQRFYLSDPFRMELALQSFIDDELE